jgi:dipeptidyl-peptidase-4
VNAAERYIYVVGLNGKGKTMLSKGKGWHAASFNSDFSYFMNVFSNMNTPPVYSLLNSNGTLVRTLEENKALKSKLQDYNLTQVSFSTIKNELGDDMNMYTILPPNFDSTAKHPLLMYVYGGPGSQTVMNRWTGSNYFWFQLLAQKGYIVVSIDGRGTGFKGEKFKKCTYLNLGKFEIADQIFAARNLGSLPYVDANRMAIWGWSFGGYMAGLGISKGNDVFKSAISVAPVTNWRYYDNIYTERFMRTPQENGTNYDDNSPLNHVEKIKGNYLIIHGTADDNVHFQNAVEMVDMMIKKGVKFDSEFYPNKNHGIGGSKTRLHLYERMTRFLVEKL